MGFLFVSTLRCKLQEGRDLLCPVSTVFLMPRRVPGLKQTLNQDLLNETVKLGLDRGLSDAKTKCLTHPTPQFFFQLFLPSLLM